ncbi:unnamed protein product [Candidula unifasciata]|uniref:Uncharacterized protein n=1 Tax=Candidula unifasciata TaxID=100452 RepID=A0A8S3Z9Q1_9EUPU|nr:unnamed protein product [Candidula unifasciata]
MASDIRQALLLVLCVFNYFMHLCAGSQIWSIFPMDSHSSTLLGGGLSAVSDRLLTIRLVGVDLFRENGLYFTTSNSTCALVKSSGAFYPSQSSLDRTNALIEVKFEHLPGDDAFWYMCLLVKNNASVDGGYVAEHQGSAEWLKIKVYKEVIVDPYLLPLWLQITLCLVMLVLSGLFSGLNLGLMSLDQTELRIIEKVGNDEEKKHAKRIAPLRKRGNFLLCTLLLGNVLVNSTFTIFFDNMTNGLIAVICSTVGIVVFGEIIPQAICSRHGLAIGARTYWVTVFFMIVTFPASFPISLVLDCVLGEEMGQVFNKEKLQELIRMTADRQVLHDNEANIISGALQLTNKSVEDVMTKIEDVFMLDVNTVLDFEKMTEIMHQGYTRIPVYDGEKTNIISLLNTKDLALIDPDDKTPLSTVCKFYDHRPLFVDYDLRLDAMLQTFLQGNSHMAIVQKLHNTDDQDPYFETLGVITLEDVIEEILQSEIVDETDMRIDNRQKGCRPLRQKEDYTMLVPDERKSTLPKQLAFAAFQFLTTTVEPFSDKFIARNVLKNLMKKDIVVNLSPTEPETIKNYIYIKGVPSDKFVLILQGTVEVVIGGESMVFESGPFSYFGVECIDNARKCMGTSETKSSDYIPDFSVRAITDVQYLSIHRAMYIAALRTTRMLRQSGSITVHDAFEAEYEKVKSSENRSKSNSVSDSYSPPLNMPLDAIKYDETAKKKSTSSLDRLTFFHRKNDPLEGMYRIRRTGSDAKDRSPENQEMNGKTNDHSMSATQVSPTSDWKKNYDSFNVPYGNRKLNHLSEVDDSKTINGGDIRRTASSGIVKSNVQAPNAGDTSVKLDSASDDLNDSIITIEDGQQEKVPLVVIETAGGHKNTVNLTIQVSQANNRVSKDAERVPLMNRDAASEDFASS